MITYQKKFIRIAEYWHAERAADLDVDLVRFFQQSEPLTGAYCREFYSILLDLRLDQDTLLARMKKTTRYEILRAGVSDNLIYEIWNGNEGPILDEFCDHYDRFAEQKAQPKLDRAWLMLLANGSHLNISRVRDAEAETLVWHAYHRASDRVTLLYSASLLSEVSDTSLKTRIGRANRFHHWQDILHFKHRGISTYDFGGWYEKKEDTARLNINKFKEGFGGEIVKTYICERALTLKGHLFLKTRRLILGNAI